MALRYLFCRCFCIITISHFDGCIQVHFGAFEKIFLKIRSKITRDPSLHGANIASKHVGNIGIGLAADEIIAECRAF